MSDIPKLKPLNVPAEVGDKSAPYTLEEVAAFKAMIEEDPDPWSPRHFRLVATIEQNEALRKVCADFIKQQQIYAAETVYQSDRVVEHSYELIESICEILGYARPEDEAE